jgi:hypothetical protein
MIERIEKLAEQAGISFSDEYTLTKQDLEKFVRLVAEDTALLVKLRGDVTTVSISADTTQ